MAKQFKATLSRSPGRSAWAVIFRHPVRLDPEGKPGRRVRRGLGTENRKEAEGLVAQLNEILGKENLWTSSSRAVAERAYDGRVVAAFYDGLEPEHADSEDIREDIIPLPTTAEGYRHVLVLGTTGAGKTTLVRQLIGVDPDSEPFPATSSAKTTVADLELVMAPGDYEVVATFLGRDHVRELVEECLVEAALAANRGSDDVGICRKILHHTGQRFRLAYVLGNVDAASEETGDIYEDDTPNYVVDLSDFGEPDLVSTRKVVLECAAELRALTAEKAAEVQRDLPPATSDDEKALAALFEEELDKLLRESPRFIQLIDQLMGQVSQRFDALRRRGALHNTPQSWPTFWTWRTADAGEFIRVMCLLIGNDAHLFGRLLTPVVNGLRVRGPFKPKWTADIPRLVIFDGEGLGHGPDTAVSVPAHVLERFEGVDAILLVDNAAQPMQAVPVALLRSLTATGYESKLHLCFTHFDQVMGPNLRTEAERRSHVRASIDNVVRDVGRLFGRSAERGLSARLAECSYFVGRIQRRLDPVRSKSTLGELGRLVDRLKAGEEPVAMGTSRPMYDLSTIVMNVQGVAERFHRAWNLRLRDTHWTRVRALSRRLAEGWEDHYDTLDPIGDLIRELTESLRRFLDTALRWTGGEPDEPTKASVLGELARSISTSVIELARERIWRTKLREWGSAYAEHGQRSASRRARIIRNEVYAPGVPIPSDDDLESQAFLDAVRRIVEDAARKADAILR